MRLNPTGEEKSTFPGEAPRSAAACRRLSYSGGVDLRLRRTQGGSKLQHSEGACGARRNLTEIHRGSAPRKRKLADE